MKKYRFYIAWMSESDSNCGEENGINTQKDLISEYIKGNESVDTWVFECENEEMAYLLGYKEAFFMNYTAQDSFSVVEEIK